MRTRELAVLLVGLLPASAAAELCGWETESAANTFVDAAQRRPAIAAAPDGTFLVAWQSWGSLGDDDEGFSVQARLFGRNTAPLAATEFQVNSDTGGSQFYPAVAADGDGRFVVVWSHDPGSGADDDEIRGRLFDADATPLGPEFEVNSYTTGSQWLPDVAFDGEGNFVVVWRSSASPDSDTSGHSIRARRFTAAGAPLGDDFEVNSHTLDDQWSPTVAVEPSGAFVVAWSSDTSAGDDTDEASIQARRFDAAGSPIGSDFQVNSYTPAGQFDPQIALRPAGGFVVTWSSEESPGTDDDLWSVQARRFTAAGTPEAADSQVNDLVTGLQRAPDVVVDVDGSYVVTYYSFVSDGTENDSGGVLARVFDAAGVPLGPHRQVNVFKRDVQDNPALALSAGGDLFIAWESEETLGDPDDFGVALRRFHSRPLLCDGFESGDTSAWSQTVP